VQRLAERMAGYLVYFALGAAALTFLITRDVRSTISVVIVVGACGIAAARRDPGRHRPCGTARRHHQGRALSREPGPVDTIVLDKPGTLTFGHPEVQTIVPTEAVSPEAVLKAAASAEMRSEPSAHSTREPQGKPGHGLFR
jgi:cation transport ATPase